MSMWTRRDPNTSVNPKIGMAARRCGLPKYIVLAVWGYVVDYAAMNEERGSISGMDLEEAQFVLELEEDKIKSCINAMKQGSSPLIEGEMIFCGQDIFGKSEAERKREYRERKKAEEQANMSRMSQNVPDMSYDVLNVPINERTDERTDGRTNGQKKNKQKKTACGAGEAETEFRTFWKAYPEKKSKGQAEKAFRTARKNTDLQTILDGLERYKSAKEDWQKWRYPATWLNGKGWLDETDETAQSPPDGTKREPGTPNGEQSAVDAWNRIRDGTESLIGHPVAASLLYDIPDVRLDGKNLVVTLPNIVRKERIEAGILSQLNEQTAAVTGGKTELITA
jgi:hypothetical protein